MFNFLKSKKKEGDEDNLDAETEDSDNSENAEDKEKENSNSKKDSIESSSGAPSLLKISTEVDRLKAGQEAFQEVRKSFTERFTHLSEQIGELRSMILDRDRTIQTLELKSVKAIDLVESIKPDKFMMDLERQNVKIEALKANLEGNEAIIDQVMEELKEIRRKMSFFRGVEEIIRLSEEIKKELIGIKKIEGTINIQTDKVQTIYSDMRKKMQDLDTFNSQLQESKANIEQNTKELDSLKTKSINFAEKEEVDKIIEKVQKYSDSLKEIQKKTPLSRDIEKLKSLLGDIN
jgi:DNA repair exonuclease SbcCD ATPase subunit